MGEESTTQKASPVWEPDPGFSTFLRVLLFSPVRTFRFLTAPMVVAAKPGKSGTGSEGEFDCVKRKNR